jgi:hypothetical protein
MSDYVVCGRFFDTGNLFYFSKGVTEICKSDNRSPTARCDFRPCSARISSGLEAPPPPPSLPPSLIPAPMPTSTGYCTRHNVVSRLDSLIAVGDGHTTDDWEQRGSFGSSGGAPVSAGQIPVKSRVTRVSQYLKIPRVEWEMVVVPLTPFSSPKILILHHSATLTTPAISTLPLSARKLPISAIPV